MRIDQIVVLSARSCNRLNSFRNYDNMIDNEILVLEIKVTQDLSVWAGWGAGSATVFHHIFQSLL